MGSWVLFALDQARILEGKDSRILCLAGDWR